MKLNNYIDNIINAIKHSLIRSHYYEQTGDVRFLNESNDWIDVARIYMREIRDAETCEVEDGTYCS